MKNLKFVTSLTLLSLLLLLTACTKSDENFTRDTLIENGVINQDTKPNTEIATERHWTSGGVYFGAAWDDGCYLHGICKIEWGNAASVGGDATVALSYNADNSFKMAFPDPAGHPELKGDFFQMDGDYTIPSELAATLGGVSYTITAGSYPLIEVGDVKMLVFPQ